MRIILIFLAVLHYSATVAMSDNNFSEEYKILESDSIYEEKEPKKGKDIGEDYDAVGEGGEDKKVKIDSEGPYFVNPCNDSKKPSWC